jgi:hypothetical protein
MVCFNPGARNRESVLFAVCPSDIDASDPIVIAMVTSELETPKSCAVIWRAAMM